MMIDSERTGRIMEDNSGSRKDRNCITVALEIWAWKGVVQWLSYEKELCLSHEKHSCLCPAARDR